MVEEAVIRIKIDPSEIDRKLKNANKRLLALAGAGGGLGAGGLRGGGVAGGGLLQAGAAAGGGLATFVRKAAGTTLRGGGAVLNVPGSLFRRAGRRQESKQNRMLRRLAFSEVVTSIGSAITAPLGLAGRLMGGLSKTLQKSISGATANARGGKAAVLRLANYSAGSYAAVGKVIGSANSLFKASERSNAKFKEFIKTNRLTALSTAKKYNAIGLGLQAPGALIGSAGRLLSGKPIFNRGRPDAVPLSATPGRSAPVTSRPAAAGAGKGNVTTPGRKLSAARHAAGAIPPRKVGAFGRIAGGGLAALSLGALVGILSDVFVGVVVPAQQEALKAALDPLIPDSAGSLQQTVNDKIDAGAKVIEEVVTRAVGAIPSALGAVGEIRQIAKAQGVLGATPGAAETAGLLSVFFQAKQQRRTLEKLAGAEQIRETVQAFMRNVLGGNKNMAGG